MCKPVKKILHAGLDPYRFRLRLPYVQLGFAKVPSARGSWRTYTVLLGSSFSCVKAEVM